MADNDKGLNDELDNNSGSSGDSDKKNKNSKNPKGFSSQNSGNAKPQRKRKRNNGSGQKSKQRKPLVNSHTKEEGLSTHTNQDMPQFLRENGGARKVVLTDNQTTTPTGITVSRGTVEWLKFSPLGESGSIVRYYVMEMLGEAKSRLVSSNLDYTVIGGMPTISVKMVDEYLEMTLSYIVAYQFLSQLYSLSRYEVVGKTQEINNYARKVMEPMRGMGARLSSMRMHIQQFHLPNNLVKLVTEDTFGIYVNDDTSTIPRVEIIGIIIPTNYSTYTLTPPYNVYTEKQYSKPVTDEVKPWCAEFNSETLGNHLGYNPDETLCIPMRDKKDVLKASNLVSNMESWMTMSNATFQTISKLLNLVVPGWQLKDHSYIFEAIPPMSSSKRTWIRNFALITDGLPEVGDSPYPTPGYNADTPESMAKVVKQSIEYVSSDDDKLPLYYLYLLWYSCKVNGNSVAYPGMFLRIPTRTLDNEDNSQANRRYTLRRDGTLKQQVGLDEQSTHQRHFNRVVEYNRIYRNTLVTDDVQSIPSPQLWEPAGNFVKYLFQLDDFLASPKFRSNSLHD